MAKNETIPRKWEAAIAALLSHGTYLEAATACGTSVATLRRLLKDPAFCAAYSEAKRQVFEGSINLLRSGGADAATALRQIVNDWESTPSARVSAARAILEITLNVAELQDLAERVTELQATLGRGER